MRESKLRINVISILLCLLCIMLFLPMLFVFVNAFKTFKEVITLRGQIVWQCRSRRRLFIVSVPAPS